MIDTKTDAVEFIKNIRELRLTRPNLGDGLFVHIWELWIGKKFALTEHDKILVELTGDLAETNPEFLDEIEETYRKELKKEKYQERKGHTDEYRIWKGMHQRCYNTQSISYKYYGGRGIIIDERWHSFSNFYADMGKKPGTPKEYSIDRIDPNGNYGPGNCRWATKIEQAKNKNCCCRKYFSLQECISKKK